MIERRRRFAWGVLALNLAVALWGALVRASGSGAGCGSHWPLCNGQVVPRAKDIETLIEFTHRFGSALALVGVLVLLVWVVRTVPRGRPARRAVLWAAIFMALEAALGAWLVLAELVAGNASLLRGVTTSLHLLNTLFLLAALTLAAHYLGGGRAAQVRDHPGLSVALSLAVGGVLLLGMTGAIAALGDTLFPAASVQQGLARDLSPGAHAFVRSRALHPLLAVLVGVYIIAMSWWVSARYGGRRVSQHSRRTGILVAVQLVAGVLNLVLLAPVWMQLLHLLLADLVWISLILLAAEVLAKPAGRARALPRAAEVVRG